MKLKPGWYEIKRGERAGYSICACELTDRLATYFGTAEELIDLFDRNYFYAEFDELDPRYTKIKKIRSPGNRRIVDIKPVTVYMPIERISPNG